MNRRIIEQQMPLTAVSAHSAREKSIRHGHPSTLHIWWARRPLAASRAAVYAALVPYASDPAEAARQQAFIADLANWDHSIDNPAAVKGKPAHHYIRDARAAIRATFPDAPPRVLDPFAGGGAIPLEALRLGCETYALDLNPVAHIIQRATLVYPQQYGTRLADDVRRWGQQVLAQARHELGDLYPVGSNGATPVAYLWARTIACPNPQCGVPVPLIRQTWLARKRGKYAAYTVEAPAAGQPIQYRVVGPVARAADLGFDPTHGTTRGGSATCPACGSPLGEKHIKAEAQAGRLGSVPLAVVTAPTGKGGKQYRTVTDADRAAFAQAEQRLHHLHASYDPFSGALPPVPDEPISTNTQYSPTPLYGMTQFGHLFNPRQALALATFVKHVRAAHAAMLEQGYDAEYARAVTTMLACVISRMADKDSVLAIWNNIGEKVEHTFGRQAIPMVWDYAEINPFSGGNGDWASALEWVLRYTEHGAASADQPADVQRGSATAMPYPDGFFDAVITDPPYYDSVPYADLSDFFYVWLRRTIGDLYPAVLGTPLTPKAQEIVQNPLYEKNKAYFEKEMGNAFAECARVLKDDGICVVVYAHKAISAWETLVAALLDAGLTVDGSWPFSTERPGRLRAQNSAALASSIFLVCRKRTTDAGTGIASAVQAAIRANVRERLDDFWQAGLRGADFFISAIGPATAAFSRYDSVMTLGGDIITVSTLLEWVQQTVADYALQRVFAGNNGHPGEPTLLGDVDDETRFYVLWRWTYDGQASVVGSTGETSPVAVSAGAGARRPAAPAAGDDDAASDDDDAASDDDDAASTGSGSDSTTKKVAKIPFGDAHLMATALGADVNALINRYHILEGKSTVRLLAASERDEQVADMGDPRADGARPPLIDIVHRCELLWASGQHALLEEYLDELTPTDREAARRVAQALVDLLPRGDSEKQRLEGFLYSNAAIERGDSAPRHTPTVQRGLGADFGQTDQPIRKRKKGRS